MEQVIENFKSLEWWFTGTFFILFGLLIGWGIKHVPSNLKKVLRGQKAKHLKELKSKRRWQSEVNYEITKEKSYFLVFSILCVTYIGWLAYEPIREIAELSTLLWIVFIAPVYIAEFAWLIQKERVKKLIAIQKRI